MDRMSKNYAVYYTHNNKDTEQYVIVLASSKKDAISKAHPRIRAISNIESYLITHCDIRIS